MFFRKPYLIPHPFDTKQVYFKKTPDLGIPILRLAPCLVRNAFGASAWWIDSKPRTHSEYAQRQRHPFAYFHLYFYISQKAYWSRLEKYVIKIALATRINPGAILNWYNLRQKSGKRTEPKENISISKKFMFHKLLWVTQNTREDQEVEALLLHL